MEMIVVRYTLHIQPGKFQEAIEWANEGRKNVWSNTPGKIYSSTFGPMNTIVIENEYEDFAEWQKSRQIGTTEKWASWVAKWNEIVDGHGTSEVWTVE
jgi:hypothetical protein